MNKPAALIFIITLALVGALLYSFGWMLIGPLLHLRHILAGIYAPLAFLPLAHQIIKKLHPRADLPISVLFSYTMFLTLALPSATAFLLTTVCLLSPATLTLVALLLFVIYRKWWAESITGFIQKPVIQNPEYTQLSFNPLSLLFFPIALILLGAAILSPLGYDAHEYHLAVPEQYLQSHSWIAFPHNIYAAFPMNVEMLYTWPLAANSAAGCTVINLLFAFTAACALYSSGKNRDDNFPALLAPIIFLSTGLVINLVWQANIDSSLCASSAILLLAYERIRHNYIKLDFCFIVLAIGFALGAKYIAVLSILAPFIVMSTCDALRNKNFSITRYTIFTTALGVALFLPWLMRNWILYANPVYPLLYDWLGGTPPFYNELFQAAHSPKPAGLSEQVLQFIITLFIKPFSASGLPLGFSGLWILGIPALFFGRHKAFTLRLTLFAITTYVLWFCLTQRNDRFLASILPVLSILPAFGVSTLINQKSQAYLKSAIALVLLIQLWAAGSLLLTPEPADQLGSPVMEEDYLAGRMPHYKAIQWLNQRQAEGHNIGTVLFIGEAQTYGARFEHIAPTVFNHHPLEDGLPPGITHILYNEAELERLTRGYGPLGWPLGTQLEQWVENNKNRRLIQVYDAYPENPGRVLVFMVQP